MKKTFLFIITTFFFISCSQKEPQQLYSGEKLTVTDDIGRTVTLSKTPVRVISFAPNVTEMIYALHAEDKLVGITAWCNYPPQTKEKEIVGDATTANLERILALKPDLTVIVGTKNTPILAKLEALKIPVVVLNPVSIDDIFRDIKLLSVVLNKQAVADSLLIDIGTALREIKSSLEVIPQGKRPKVYAEISSQPLMTAGNMGLVGLLIEQAGGENIVSDIGQDYAVINPEIVIQRRPDIVLILHPQTDKKRLSERIGWQNIPAVKNKKVFDDLDLDIVLRAGPRSVMGLKELNRIFYEK
ncbi:MAG: cobalamin-binding protein [Candidatus Edwardsbacteria bacterium]|nr:cobalamin-binding protein [Candidatus Edwardsbacteria bacterium]MBU1576619.1 cobalamin-binding protein [Candidatus Edwardsbacteria bacterium]MBU2463047.1 cobalamin-binding protein [Candidatus Edwardsbacteria bacterium]MBU2594962.1 cobalamin-binding protein [Candidatus Edwardsbacteria bacterium]